MESQHTGGRSRRTANLKLVTQGILGRLIYITRTRLKNRQMNKQQQEQMRKTLIKCKKVPGK
jgi:hypothetical protein